MKKIFCNPLNLSYKYQFLQVRMPMKEGDKIVGYNVMQESLVREAADPSVVRFKGKYYMFPSMSKGFWVSEDLENWKYVSLKNTPSYDYAPDVCVIGDYLYFSASKKGENCKFYRTKDPEKDFEEVAESFEFWDPALFYDDDGKVYFYWGCSNSDPIYGTQLNLRDMGKIGETSPLIKGDDVRHGFERVGEDHVLEPLGPDASDYEKYMRMFAGTNPFIEGAWMTKYEGKYYLQYAAPSTETNTYADGVYISDQPLQGFTYAENNPYSYKPGGFITAAGHGSTFKDEYGNYWHAASMRISAGHRFERRVGIFPAGFDDDGELFCNQRYGDWPTVIPHKKADPWAEPEMYLLSYCKKVRASSEAEGRPAENAVNENIRNWWRAVANKKGEWLEVDLGDTMHISAVQINFADELSGQAIPKPNDAQGDDYQLRYIEDRTWVTRWILEGSLDGKTYFTIADKGQAITDLPHDFLLSDCHARFIRLTVFELPYGQAAAVSGLRVFGKGRGDRPSVAKVLRAVRTGELDAELAWQGDALGYTVLWGHSPEKLYHSYTVYGRTHLTLRALNKGQRTWVRVDSFNENGITHGETCEIK